ncbi:MAG: GreA/GreB family elongation factor [Bacilli bacterium]|nr:GreA/GreB family elongation factor [Bacilli bacterium]
MNKENNDEKRVQLNDIVVIELTEERTKQLSNTYRYQIIADYDHSRKDNANKVSSTSPLGIRLISGKVGDTGKYHVHEYHYEYKIVDIIKNNEQINNESVVETKPKTRIKTK